MASIAYYHRTDAEDFVLRSLTKLVSDGLKDFLESKHLYQKVSFDTKTIVAAAKSRLVNDDDKFTFDNWARLELPLERLSISNKELFSPLPNRRPLLTLVVKNLKLYCKKCDRREAFNPVWYMDFITESASADARNLIKFAYPKSLPAGFQLFLLVYQCQSCQGQPEAVLVRREGWELALHGRSPMERVEVPKYIPKSEAKHFRDSVIAFNTGKMLAALFYLRIFIEQFARRVTGKTGKVTGDKIMDAYNETIPPKHRDSMPSLREWYDKLSAPIHEASDDAETYNTARDAIEKHFEIRDVFKLPESTPADSSPKQPTQPPHQPDSADII